jgi:DNA repair protein RadC
MHLTKRLKDALDLVGVRVLDHLIVAGNQATSMQETGTM